MRKVGNLFLTKDGSFSDGEREFFNVGREFLYTSCGPAAHAFLPLRSTQARTSFVGQVGFASHKPLRFRPSGLQIPPVLASPKRPSAAPPQAPSVASRRRRYNTLDLASKIVCQRQASPALLWKPPGYRQHHFSARERNVFCRYSFSTCATKSKIGFCGHEGK